MIYIIIGLFVMLLSLLNDVHRLRQSQRALIDAMEMSIRATMAEMARLERIIDPSFRRPSQEIYHAKGFFVRPSFDADMGSQEGDKTAYAMYSKAHNQQQMQRDKRKQSTQIGNVIHLPGSYRAKKN